MRHFQLILIAFICGGVLSGKPLDSTTDTSNSIKINSANSLVDSAKLDLKDTSHYAKKAESALQDNVILLNLFDQHHKHHGYNRIGKKPTECDIQNPDSVFFLYQLSMMESVFGLAYYCFEMDSIGHISKINTTIKFDKYSSSVDFIGNDSSSDWQQLQKIIIEKVNQQAFREYREYFEDCWGYGIGWVEYKTENGETCYRAGTHTYHVCIIYDAFANIISSTVEDQGEYYNYWKQLGSNEPCSFWPGYGVSYLSNFPGWPDDYFACSNDEIKNIEEARRRLKDEILVESENGQWCGGNRLDVLKCMQYYVDNIYIYCTFCYYGGSAGNNSIELYHEGAFKDWAPCRLLQVMFHELTHLCGSSDNGTKVNGSSYDCEHACMDPISKAGCKIAEFDDVYYRYCAEVSADGVCDCNWDPVTGPPKP